MALVAMVLPYLRSVGGLGNRGTNGSRVSYIKRTNQLD